MIRQLMLKTAIVAQSALMVVLSAGCISGHPHGPNHRVLILAGHVEDPPGPPDTRGAPSFAGVLEYRFNDAIVTLLGAANNRVPGVNCETVLSGRNMGLRQRVEYANKRRPDLYIEIHHDAAQPDDLAKARKEGPSAKLWNEIRGFSVHYSEQNPMPQESRRFANLLAQEMLAAGRTANLYHADHEKMTCVDRRTAVYNRIPPWGLYVLYNVQSPSVVLECGTIANPREEKELASAETRRAIVEAVYRAIGNYFGPGERSVKEEPCSPAEQAGGEPGSIR